MFNQPTKPQHAREIEARARARQHGVRVVVVSEAQHYTTPSQSRPGVTHTIQRTPAGWACSCEGYRHTGVCKHIGQVERRSEREGWDFGAIAPLHRVGRYLPLVAAGAESRPATAVVIPFRQRHELADSHGVDPAGEFDEFDQFDAELRRA